MEYFHCRRGLPAVSTSQCPAPSAQSQRPRLTSVLRWLQQTSCAGLELYINGSVEGMLPEYLPFPFKLTEVLYVTMTLSCLWHVVSQVRSVVLSCISSLALMVFYIFLRLRITLACVTAYHESEGPKYNSSSLPPLICDFLSPSHGYPRSPMVLTAGASPSDMWSEGQCWPHATWWCLCRSPHFISSWRRLIISHHHKSWVQHQKMFTEKEIHITFIIVYCYNCSVSLLAIIVSHWLCLICKLNCIVGMYVQERKHRVYRVQYYPGFQASPGILECG